MVNISQLFDEFIYNRRDKRKRGQLYFDGPILVDGGQLLAARGRFGLQKCVLVEACSHSPLNKRHASRMARFWTQETAYISFRLLEKAGIPINGVVVIDNRVRTTITVCSCGREISSNDYRNYKHRDDGSPMCEHPMRLGDMLRHHPRPYGYPFRSLRTLYNHDVVPTNTLFTTNGKNYLFGIDLLMYSYDQSYWRLPPVPYLCELPRKSSNVDDAILSLVPDMGDRWECGDVQRQGNLFFAETSLSPRDIPGKFVKNFKIGNHYVTEGKVHEGKIYVRGVVSHATMYPYRSLRLGKQSMYRVYENRAVRRWKINEF